MKRKYSESMGFGMYGSEFQSKETRLSKFWGMISENSIEIVMISLFAAMIFGVAVMMSTAANAVDMTIQAVEENILIVEENYQMEQLIRAIELNADQAEKNHPVTGAEMPPYWTAPKESY